MKVLVTGASGFIGSVTVRELTAAGHQVVGIEGRVVTEDDASERVITW